jgi:hypothetical protein
VAKGLLSRDAFREAVFARDRRRCVVCRGPAQDAHHLLERRLFADGGYWLDNGVSLCSAHHREAEATTLSCESLRAAAGIERVVLPPHLYPERRYDKWGDPVRADGLRLRGELFFEEPVQKVLAPVLRSFVPRAEEPRVPDLPWSTGAAGFVLADPRALVEDEVVVLAEPDGEVLSVDAEGVYVGAGEPVEPTGLEELPRLVGELLPIGGRLSGVRGARGFVVAAAWDGRDTCLAWDETTLLAELLGLPVVATLARGWLSLAQLQALAVGPHRVRRAGAFTYSAHRRCVGRVAVRG